MKMEIVTNTLPYIKRYTLFLIKNNKKIEIMHYNNIKTAERDKTNIENFLKTGDPQEIEYFLSNFKVFMNMKDTKSKDPLKTMEERIKIAGKEIDIPEKPVRRIKID